MKTITNKGKVILEFLKRGPIHPIFFAAFPVLALMAHNIDQIQPGEGIRSLILSMLLSLITLIILRLLVGNWSGAAFLTSFLVFLFFSYGHVYSFLERIEIGSFQIGRHRYLVPIWALLGIASILVGRINLQFPSQVTSSLNIIAIVMVIINCAPLLNKSLTNWMNRDDFEVETHIEDEVESKLSSPAELPDVYYIVTDSYARFDVLNDSFNYDNSDFSEFLSANDFYVAEESRANYLFTHLSLTTSLNAQYLDVISPDYSSGDRLPLKNNFVRSAFSQSGYTIVGFASGWDATEWFNADIVMTPEIGEFEVLKQSAEINSFESILMETTALFILLDFDALRSTPVSQFIQSRLQNPFTIQRDIVLAQFDNLERASKIDGPKFVFVHILPPHGPHVFGPNGEPLQHEGAYTLASGPEDENEEESGYLDALTYVNKRLEQAISAILKNSNRPVIIILQSDHGPSVDLKWDDPTPEALRAKAAILNAYHVPDSCEDDLYPSITPVNTFRLIFSCAFNAELPLLEDRTYYGYDTHIPIEEVLP